MPYLFQITQPAWFCSLNAVNQWLSTCTLSSFKANSFSAGLPVSLPACLPVCLSVSVSAVLSGQVVAIHAFTMYTLNELIIMSGSLRGFSISL